MERLLYSKPPIPSQFRLRHIPFLRQPAPLSTTSAHSNKKFRFRVNSLSCNYQDPSSISSAVSSKSANDTDHSTRNLSSSFVDKPDESTEKVNFLRKVVESLTQQQKQEQNTLHSAAESHDLIKAIMR